MKNRYAMVKAETADNGRLKNDRIFEKMLCEGILLSLRDLGYLCEIEYRRAREMISEKIGGCHK